MTDNDWSLLADHGITRENHTTLTYVTVWDCPSLTALPDLPNATNVDVWNLPSLTALPDLRNATTVTVRNLPGVTALPDLPNATNVHVGDCPGIPCLYTDPRGYSLIRIGDLYFAGCRTFSRAEALAHWGSDDYPDRERGAAFCAAINATPEA